MKLIMENWRRYITELDLTDPDLAFIAGAKDNEDLLKRTKAIKDAYLSLVAGWNSTAGEVLFKIPDTPGAEGYTFADLGLDLGLTLLGAGIGAKAAIKIEKYLMKLYRKHYWSNRMLYKYYLNSAAEAAIILRAKAPAKIKAISATAAITPEVFLETLVEPEIKDMLLKTKQKGEVVEIPPEIASRLNMKMN